MADFSSEIDKATSVAPVPARYKWWLTIICTLLAIILFSIPVLYLCGGFTLGTGLSPSFSGGGVASVGVFLFLALLYLLLIRLVFQWSPICPFDRWRYAVVITILAILIFSPFLYSILRGLIPYAGAWLFIIQLILFFFITRLVLI